MIGEFCGCKEPKKSFAGCECSICQACDYCRKEIRTYSLPKDHAEKIPMGSTIEWCLPKINPDTIGPKPEPIKIIVKETYISPFTGRET